MDKNLETREDLLMKFFADRARHLVCIPYSRANLFAMAEELNIPNHWAHLGRGLDHFDIPKRQIERVLSDPRVEVVSPRVINSIVRGRALPSSLGLERLTH